MSISFENPIVGDIGGDQEDSLGASPPQKKHKLDDKECHGAKEKEKEMPTSEKDSCCSNEIFTISDEQFEKLMTDYSTEGVEEIDPDVWTMYSHEIEEREVLQCGTCEVLRCFLFCPPPPLSSSL